MITYEPGRILVAAHRGVSGANVPCNSKAAFNIALSQGADIVELDVSKSKDGKLFVFHPGMETKHLNLDVKLPEMTAAEIEKLRYVNQDDVITSYKIVPLEEMLEFLKDKVYINIDKYWLHIEEITHALRKTGVEKQTIVKIPDKIEYIDAMEKCAPDIAVMPIYWHKDEFTDILLERNVKYIGAEVCFVSDKDEVASDDYIEKMHKHGLLVYGNAILFNESTPVAAGHTDDVALAGDPDTGWGWFVDKKFDIIQTDWCLMLRNYLKEKMAKE